MQEVDQREVSVGYSTQRFTLFFPPALPEKRGGRNKRSCLLNGRSAGLDCQRRFLTTSLSSHSPTLCPTLSLSLSYSVSVPQRRDTKLLTCVSLKRFYV